MPVSFFTKTTVAICSALCLLSAQAAQDKSANASIADTLADVISAEIALHRGMPLTAYRYYNEALDRTEHTDIAALAWRAAMQTNDTELLLSAAHRWIELDPKSEIPHQTILMNAVQNGHQEEFLKELALMYRIAEDKEDWVVRVTKTLARQSSKLPFVESGLEPYWEKEADNAQVQIAIGLFRQTQGNLPEACRSATRAFELSPDDEKVVAASAEICWRHDKKQSEQILVRFLNKHPDDAPIALIYSQVLARTGHPDRALSEIKKAVRNAPEDPAILLNAGILAFDCRTYDLAEDYLNQYVEAARNFNPEIDLSSNDVWTRLADAAHQAGKHTEEAGYLAKLTTGPLAPEARIREANVLVELNRLNDALELLEKASIDSPKDASLFRTTRAKLLVANNRADDALAMMQAELLKDPDNVATLYDTAMTAVNLNQRDLAEGYLLKLLELAPDHVQGNNALGYIWVVANRNLTEARSLIEHAYRLAPADPYVLDSMGWLCFKEGRYDQAAEFTITSLKKLFDIEVAGHLVEILYKGGRVQEAKDFYLTLRQRTQNDPSVIEIGKKLGLEKK